MRRGAIQVDSSGVASSRAIAAAPPSGLRSGSATRRRRRNGRRVFTSPVQSARRYKTGGRLGPRGNSSPAVRASPPPRYLPFIDVTRPKDARPGAGLRLAAVRLSRRADSPTRPRLAVRPLSHPVHRREPRRRFAPGVLHFTSRGVREHFIGGGPVLAAPFLSPPCGLPRPPPVSRPSTRYRPEPSRTSTPCVLHFTRCQRRWDPRHRRRRSPQLARLRPRRAAL